MEEASPEITLSPCIHCGEEPDFAYAPLCCVHCGKDRLSQEDYAEIQTVRDNYAAQARQRYQTQLILNVFILCLLLMFPVFTLLSGGYGVISLLLFLPVVAWFYIGVWRFIKK